MEGAAFANRAIRGKGAAARLHEAQHHGKPQPGTLADLTGSEERIENAFPRSFVHPVPRIPNAQAGITALLETLDSGGKRLVNRDPFEPYRDNSPSIG